MDDQLSHENLREEMSSMRTADASAHGLLNDKLDVISKQQIRMQTITEERAMAEGTLRRQVFALVLLFLGSIGGIVGWTATTFTRIQEDVANNTAHFREFQAIGIRWGEDIDQTAAETKEDLRQLRRLVNEHQRNNKKHVR